MLAKARRVRREQSGFTLIELLIVIVIIGILAGIAILAFSPFEESAELACERANDRIGEGVDAAAAVAERPAFEELGLTADDFLRDGTGALDCDSLAGGTSFSAPSVQAESTSGNGSQTVTLASSPTEGNLLVAVGATRNPSLDLPDPEGSGWSLAGSYASSSGGNKSVGVWTKQAGASESASITWPTGSDSAFIVREYAVSGLSVAADDEGVTTSSPLMLGPVSGGSGPGLVITAAMTRTATSISWSGVGSAVEEQKGTTPQLTVSTAHQVVSNASATQSPEASGAFVDGAAGVVVILQP